MTAGWSAICLGLFYLWIDVWKLHRWALPFVWIGMNPILLYLLESLASSQQLASRIVGGNIEEWLSHSLFPGAGELLLALTASAISITIAWYLHHRRVYLRV